MAEQEMLPVERCDRELFMKLLLPTNLVSRDIEGTLAGKQDRSPAMQLLAAHRLAATKAADERVHALSEHLAEQITHIEIRIQDGRKMGAAVWRIALEDIVRENRAALAEAGGRHG